MNLRRDDEEKLALRGLDRAVHADDALLEAWVARWPSARPARASQPPPGVPPRSAPPPPIGDVVADRWFK